VTWSANNPPAACAATRWPPTPFAPSPTRTTRRACWPSSAAPGASHPWLTALVNPQDPGNIGTIVRTLDAVGASGLILLDGGADPGHPNAVRASLGALFWLPIVSASFDDFAAWAGQHAYHIHGASEAGAATYDAVAYRRPMILLMGSEREGLTRQQEAVCESTVRLPMVGRVTSLNLAVATGVMLYAMARGPTGP
jgi:TrmH family RNA methyltransferase